MNLLKLSYRLALQNHRYGMIRLPLARRIKQKRIRDRIIEKEYIQFFMLWDVLPEKTDQNLRDMLYRLGKTGVDIGVYSAAAAAGGVKNMPVENRQANVWKFQLTNQNP